MPSRSLKKTYLFSYRFQNARVEIELQATSPQEAKERLAALAFANLERASLKQDWPIAPTF